MLDFQTNISIKLWAFLITYYLT